MPITEGCLMVTAGDNPVLLGGEAAFAHLCGVPPIPASSGKTTRHRPNRGGEREADKAPYLLAVRQMGSSPFLTANPLVMPTAPPPPPL
jgi:hypothetical protein